MADSTAVQQDARDEYDGETIANIEYLGGEALNAVIELHLNEEDTEALEKMRDELLAWVLKQYGGDDTMICLPFSFEPKK